MLPAHYLNRPILTAFLFKQACCNRPVTSPYTDMLASTNADILVLLSFQALCILANVADGDSAKDFIMSNEDVLKKLMSYMVSGQFSDSHDNDANNNNNAYNNNNNDDDIVIMLRIIIMIIVVIIMIIGIIVIIIVITMILIITIITMIVVQVLLLLLLLLRLLLLLKW